MHGAIKVITLVMVFLISSFPTIQVSFEESVMRWKFTLSRLVVWLMAELILSMLGMDDLADYSEFLLEKSSPVLAVQKIVVQ